MSLTKRASLAASVLAALLALTFGAHAQEAAAAADAARTRRLLSARLQSIGFVLCAPPGRSRCDPTAAEWELPLGVDP